MTKGDHMRLSLALLATGFWGATAASQPGSPPNREPRRAPVYISLMGEPFRGAPGGQHPAQQWLAGADANADGAIDSLEMQKDAARFFATLDLDRDGRIDPDEMRRYENEVAPAALRRAGGAHAIGDDRRRRPSGDSGGRGPGDGGPPGGGRPPAGGPPPGGPGGGGPGGAPGRGIELTGIPQPVAMADTDLNRYVTAEEFASAAMKRFSSNDRDHNGLLKADELGRSYPGRRR